MPEIFSHEWDTEVFKGKTSFNTGLYINGKYVDGQKGKTIEWVVVRFQPPTPVLNNLIVIIWQCCQPQFVVFEIWPRHNSHWTSPPFLGNGQVITKVSEATEEDVDIAVEAAQKAFETTWGLNTPGSVRSELLWKLAKLMERDSGELAAIEALDNGWPFLNLPHFFFFYKLLFC